MLMSARDCCPQLLLLTVNKTDFWFDKEVCSLIFHRSLHWLKKWNMKHVQEIIDVLFDEQPDGGPEQNKYCCASIGRCL